VSQGSSHTDQFTKSLPRWGSEKVDRYVLMGMFFSFVLFCVFRPASMVSCATLLHALCLPFIPYIPLARNAKPKIEEIPKRQRMHPPNSASSRGHAPSMYKNRIHPPVRVNIGRCGRRGTSRRAAASPAGFRRRGSNCHQVSVHSHRSPAGGEESTYNIAASPTCLICLPQSALAAFCVIGSRSKGCGSTVRTSARARLKIERARR
jgi:hypothetical protein